MNAQERAAFSAMDAKIKADPDIRRILDANRARLAATRDKGGSARDFQHRIRDQITNIAKQKGYIPDVGQAVFVNPNFENGQLELHRGWSGLSGWQKAAIIAAGAAAGVGAGALLAGGGAAAAGAGGAGTAAAGGGAGAAGAAATTAGMSIPTATTGLSSLAGIGTTVGATGAGLTTAPIANIPFSVGNAGPISVPAGAGGGGSYIQELINSGAPVTNQGGGSWLTNFLKRQGINGLSRGLGSVSETMANNRGTELDAMLAADQNQMLFERNQRENDEHNLRMMQAAEYIKNGGAPVTGPTKINSGTIDPSKFGFGPQAKTETERMVASNLQKQLMDRMQNPAQMRDYDSKMKAGVGEKVTGWLGAALDTFSGK